MSTEHNKINDISETDIVSDHNSSEADQTEGGKVASVSEENKENAENSKAPEKSLFSKIQASAAGCAETLYNFALDQNIFVRFIGIYLIVSGILIIVNRNRDYYTPNHFKDWQDYIGLTPFSTVIAVSAGVFGIVTILKVCISKLKQLNTDGCLLMAGVFLFSSAALWRSDDYWFAAAVIGVMAVLITGFIKKHDFDFLSRINKKVYIAAIAALACGMAAFISYYSIYQYRCFYDSTFDMGIFIQMYHSIVTRFSFETTCERNKILSHFAVHTSPVYILLAPFYFFFRKAETLLIAQAVIVMSGVIPLWFICRKYKFGTSASFMMCIVYIFSSSLISPCFYDFHENAFLPAFLLWFFLAIEKDRHVMMYIMMILVLSVKEDAALYVMCTGLYLLCSGRKRRHGFIIFTLSAAYFLTVTSLMGKFGEGVMTSRTYGNIMTDWDGGFGNVITSVISNPAHFMTECIKEEKIKFILVMLLPVLFTPFVSSKSSRLLLVVPFVLMNLATGYPYAFDQGYQYVFGTTACILYVSVMNLADFKKENFKKVISVMVAASFATSVCIDSGKIYFKEVHDIYHDSFMMTEKCLDSIPENASVLATTWYVPYLANRDGIYMFDEYTIENDLDLVGEYRLNIPVEFDFIVIPENNHDDAVEKLRSIMDRKNYTLYCSNSGGVEVYISQGYAMTRQ